MTLPFSHKPLLNASPLLALTFLAPIVSASETSITKPVSAIPQGGITQQGPKVLGYAEFIDSLKLKQISTESVLAPHFKTRGRTSNSIPPKYLWKNIAPTLKVVDELATRLNAAPSFLSIYRNPEYNRSVRGKSRSYALQNCAVKVRFKGTSAKTAADAARELRAEGFFNGGIGKYTTYIHIDTRGQKADW
jgi:hypothetical protein